MQQLAHLSRRSVIPSGPDSSVPKAPRDEATARRLGVCRGCPRTRTPLWSSSGGAAMKSMRLSSRTQDDRHAKTIHCPLLWLGGNVKFRHMHEETWSLESCRRGPRTPAAYCLYRVTQGISPDSQAVLRSSPTAAGRECGRYASQLEAPMTAFTTRTAGSYSGAVPSGRTIRCRGGQNAAQSADCATALAGGRNPCPRGACADGDAGARSGANRRDPAHQGSKGLDRAARPLQPTSHAAPVQHRSCNFVRTRARSLGTGPQPSGI